ncbi:aldo/keto reductase [Mycolicibacterium conceptionense]|uniref:Aldo/keto reductase n=3 Tax=Mycolicibacterium TaxID=1866885 RepID=A0ABR5FQ87_9MYCO|nr:MULTISPECIES: aldo/keto reductase [Mycolicibacterium]KLI07344.1 aldo/keto reductase [Mycolicibacterium senegalense]KLO49005.1 aldo/keto reductase [Mycolicibacterium senegalense]KMV20648.1 aldo/keto reductase [Mycolicibacterium conceptionense]OBJ92512.1 aldo/keto reductase [Mycolicibacterium conceptionense]OMB88871.1 aldo/keto reductase [Mycolicibacterium conceptionense]
MTTSHPGGTGAIGEHTVARIGYGAMGLGPEVPHDDATAVLRRAVELGVNHIDTASFYADGVVNRRIRDALAPYAEDLLIVSKVGARPATGPVPLALAQHPADLRAAVELDLAGLGLDQIPVVNLRRADLGPGLIAEGDQIVDLDDQLAEMITLRDEGKIGAIGISNVDLATLRRALPAGIVCVQNAYSLLNRSHEDELALCRAEGIAWVPFFPLGSAFPGFPKVAENAVVQRIAAEIGASGAQVGLAWLLAHAPNTMLIAGTASMPHLEENLAAGNITLSRRHLAELDGIDAQLPQGDGVQAFLDEGR